MEQIRGFHIAGIQAQGFASVVGGLGEVVRGQGILSLAEQKPDLILPALQRLGFLDALQQLLCASALGFQKEHFFGANGSALKLFLEKLSCDGKIQPAKGSDQQDEHENSKDVPSNVRWMLIRQFISLSQHDLNCPLENRSEETANETEKSASDSADATSLFNVSQAADPELPELSQSVKENTDHTIAPMPLFSGRISFRSFPS